MKFIPFDSMLLWLFTRLATMFQSFFSKGPNTTITYSTLKFTNKRKINLFALHFILYWMIVSSRVYWNCRYSTAESTRRHNCVDMFWLLYLGLLCLLLIKFQHVTFFFIWCAFLFCCSCDCSCRCWHFCWMRREGREFCAFLNCKISRFHFMGVNKGSTTFFYEIKMMIKHS